MSWDSFGKSFYHKTAQVRLFIFTPLLFIFKFLKITPNMISYSSVLFMIGYLISVYFENVNLAVLFIILAVFMDNLDGSLARYLKVDSDKGKFTDIICDNVNFMILMSGLYLLGLVDGVAAIFYSYFNLLVKVLSSVRKNLYQGSDWVIHIWSGIFPTSLIFSTYVLFFVWFFSGINWLNLTSYIFACVLLIKGVFDYLDMKNKVISKKEFLKNKFKKKRIKYLKNKKERLDKKIKKLSDK